jgi:Tfp pilus assembly protein PilF
VTRRWVDKEKESAEVIAARKKPKLFITPAEMVLALHYLSRKEMDKAEKLLSETMKIQESAELRYMCV